MKILNSIREYFWFKLLPIKLSCYIRDIGGPRRFGRILRSILFSPRNRPMYDYFNFYLNKEKADYLYERLVNRAYSYRAISRDFKLDYPDSNIQSEDQYDGYCLENMLSAYLNIDIKKEYTNAIEQQVKLIRDNEKERNIG